MVDYNERLHSQVSSGRRERFRHLLQDVQSRGFYTVLEVLLDIQALSVNFIVDPLSGIHDHADVVNVRVHELPLIIGVVFEDFETFGDPLLYAAHSVTDARNSSFVSESLSESDVHSLT